MITVLGSSGFIGSNLVRRIEELNLDCFVPERSEKLAGRQLGDIVYCVGLTADFRSRPFETVEAHVCKLIELVRDCDFNSLLYLSSTRLYAREPGPVREVDTVRVSPVDPNDLYNISKIMGEALLFASGRTVRVARLSNVYGGDFSSDNFLSSLIKEAISTNKVTLYSCPESRKDYISIEDAVNGLIDIATRGKQAIYNLASGTNVSNQEIVNRISEITGCEVELKPNAPNISFPKINIDRMSEEFGFVPSNVLSDMAKLVALYEKSLT